MHPSLISLATVSILIFTCAFLYPKFYDMNAVKLMYITVPTKELGATIARSLVQDKLAACVNMMSGGVESYYLWEGKLETGTEHVLFVKTVAQSVESVVRRTKELHPYDTPAILSLDVNGGDSQFLDWIKANTGEGTATGLPQDPSNENESGVKR